MFLYPCLPSKAHTTNLQNTEKKDINVGVFLPLTGDLKNFGEKQLNGISIAHTLRPFIAGKKIHLIFKDTKGNRRYTTQAVKKLVEKYKVSGVIGGVTEQEALGAMDAVKAKKIPLVVTTVPSPFITNNRKYVWRICSPERLKASAAAKIAIDNSANNKIAIIVDQDEDSSVMLASYFASELIKSGGIIADISFIHTGDREFITQIASIQRSGSDFIFCSAPYKEAALIIKYARTIGIYTPFIVTDIFQESCFLNLGGMALKNVYLITEFNKDALLSPLAKSFIGLYRQKTKQKQIDSCVTLAADAYFLFADVMGIMASDPELNITSALNLIKNRNYVTSKLTMEPSGDPLRELIVYTIKKKRLVYLDSVYLDPIK